tara:strand:+ start:5039 stop:5875 length:837 start_codon:yes stop_codon:yes gene_type:complete
MNIIQLFNKEDFKPHRLDGEWPLLSRVNEGTIGVISIGEFSIELYEATIHRSSVVEITQFKTINDGLNQESANLIKKESASRKIGSWVVSLATGPCPTRENLVNERPDLELYRIAKHNPKAALKDAFSANSLYAIASSQEGRGTIIFEEKRDSVQRIEGLLKELKICRIQNGIYAFVHYFSKTNTEKDLVLAVSDRESCLFLKIESGNWAQISYRKLSSAEDLETIFDEILPALNPRSLPLKWVSTSPSHVETILKDGPQEQLLKEINNPIAWSSLYA